MGVQKIPLFYSGNVLTQEMMESMKNYMVDYSILKYTGYGDGVLRGCGITTSGELLSVHPGILIAKGRPFFVSEPVDIVCEPTNTLKFLVVRVGEKEITRSFENYKLEFILAEEEEKNEKDIELCRFRLQEGTKLRYEYRDFADMNTEFDTVCLGHADWAAWGGTSISYEVLVQFAKEVQKMGQNGPEDRVFAGQILASGGETLTASSINSYIAGRLEKPYADLGIGEMYQALGEILKGIKSGKINHGKGTVRERRMIVD